VASLSGAKPLFERSRAVAELTGETLIFPPTINVAEPMSREGACSGPHSRVSWGRKHHELAH